MIALTSEISTWAHRVPAGVKFAALFGATLGILSTTAIPAQIVALGVVAGLYASCGANFARAGLRALRGILLVGLLIGLWHTLTGAPQTAALVVLRLFTAVAMAGFVTMTTRLDEITELLDHILTTVRVPQTYRARIVLAIALTIRFIPVLIAKGQGLAESWRARSVRRMSPRVVLPMALLAIDDAEHVAKSLRARGGA
ncbi:energy-coupling factor transporter transmembrane component T [Pararhodobacter sp.]|uniref:energy-coupling factor transporter transmembrane component T family protein n=1 Tax=Pararhodobacter sp. TaxID=2127056 RepID=UPI002AFF589B|nr:energy-coupling factor transporter transmembrane component T [Pararhodobacter sp.]